MFAELMCYCGDICAGWQKWFCRHHMEYYRAGHVYRLFFSLFFWHFLRHYSMIPQFLLLSYDLGLFSCVLAIEIINPVFPPFSPLSLSLSLSPTISLCLFHSQRTLSICKNFRYIVNCYAVCCCCQTTLGTDECSSIGLCSNNHYDDDDDDDDTVPVGLGCTVMHCLTFGNFKCNRLA